MKLHVASASLPQVLNSCHISSIFKRAKLCFHPACHFQSSGGASSAAEQQGSIQASSWQTLLLSRTSVHTWPHPRRHVFARSVSLNGSWVFLPHVQFLLLCCHTAGQPCEPLLKLQTSKIAWPGALVHGLHGFVGALAAAVISFELLQ